MKLRHRICARHGAHFRAGVCAVMASLFSAAFPLVVGAQADQAPSAGAVVYVIPIQGDIEPSTAVFAKRRITQALDSGAGPGNLGVSWSAGALIALSCAEIYMAPGTSMGAAAPVLPTQDGTMKAADEKTVSAVRLQMAALAEKNGHPAAIALAMVDADVELVEMSLGGKALAKTADDAAALEKEREGYRLGCSFNGDADRQSSSVDEILGTLAFGNIAAPGAAAFDDNSSAMEGADDAEEPEELS